MIGEAGYPEFQHIIYKLDACWNIGNTNDPTDIESPDRYAEFNDPTR